MELAIKPNIRNLFIATAVVLMAGAAFQAGATGITVTSQALGTSQTNFTSCSIFDSGNVSELCVSGPATSNNGAVSFGTGTANIATGVLGAAATATASTFDQVGTINSTGTASIGEFISYSGSGFLTATLQLDGFWNVSQVDIASLGFQAQGNLVLKAGSGGGGVLGTDNFTANQSGPTSGTINDLLSVTAFLSGTGTKFILADVLAQITTADGVINMENSILRVTASEGLEISFVDGNFLLQTGQVPEPATLAIFGLGLAGLGLMRRRRRAA